MHRRISKAMGEPIRSDGAREALQRAIGSMFCAFAGYRAQPHAEACACCVGDDDKRRLYRASLHDLSADDLSKYAFKAMTTWGNQDDFRGFLPRLCELQVSTIPMAIDNEIVFGKLRYARWRTWPPTEQAAVEDFLMAWGSFLLAADPGSPTMTEYLCVLALVTEDLAPFLETWRTTDSVAAVRHLAMVALEYGGGPTAFRSPWWEDVPGQRRQLESWLLEPATEARLEGAFFQYVSTSFASDLASAVDVLRSVRSGPSSPCRPPR